MINVILYEPEIHWNTGNIGRTCLAAGARLHLVEPLGFSLDEREVRRAGLDYWRYVEPVLWKNWQQLEESMLLDDAWFFSTKVERTLWDVEYGDAVSLVFGPETRGLPEIFFQRYPERFVTIPQVREEVRSLNLSSAVAIGVYEAVRRRQSRSLGV